MYAIRSYYVSLMKDQVDALIANGVSAACYNSSLTAEEARRITSYNVCYTKLLRPFSPMKSQRCAVVSPSAFPSTTNAVISGRSSVGALVRAMTMSRSATGPLLIQSFWSYNFV